MATPFRIEHDSMGEMKVPLDALYGAQTQRAVENFPISTQRLQRPFIRAMGLIKAAAARANAELGYLDPAGAQRIYAAAERARARESPACGCDGGLRPGCPDRYSCRPETSLFPVS